MATKVLWNDKPVPQQDDCLLPPPIFECEPCKPCDPCAPVCPPKTRAKDAICVSTTEVKRCFQLYQQLRCNKEEIVSFYHRISLSIRKKGYCEVITEECPISATPEGEACFLWSDVFRSLEAGYYEADLYIDNNSCGVLLFWVKPCASWAETTDIEYEEHPCHAPCIPAEHGCIPDVDIVTRLDRGACDAECE